MTVQVDDRSVTAIAPGSEGDDRVRAKSSRPTAGGGSSC